MPPWRPVVIACVCVAGLPSVRGARPAQAPAVIESLDRYSRGQYDDAVALVASPADVRMAYTELGTRGSDWIRAGDSPEAVARRRLVAASFSLEVVARSLDSVVVRRDATLDTLRVRLALVGWGAAALTSSAPVLSPDGKATAIRSAGAVEVQPGERAWYHAAIAFLECAGWAGLIDLPPGFPESRLPPDEARCGAGATGATFALIPLALARVPDEAAFRMARADAEAAFGWPLDGPAQPLFRDLTPTADEVMRRARGQVDARAASDALLHQALRHYLELIPAGPLSSEAHLRAGHVQLALGDRADARKHFDAARRSSGDAGIAFMSDLLTGWSWEADRRPADAESAYRAALAVHPHARSASTLLAALLVATDRRAEAATLMDAVLKGAGSDPWQDFWESDGLRWPACLAELRAALR